MVKKFIMCCLQMHCLGFTSILILSVWNQTFIVVFVFFTSPQ